MQESRSRLFAATSRFFLPSSFSRQVHFVVNFQYGLHSAEVVVDQTFINLWMILNVSGVRAFLEAVVAEVGYALVPSADRVFFKQTHVTKTILQNDNEFN